MHTDLGISFFCCCCCHFSISMLYEFSHASSPQEVHKEWPQRQDMPQADSFLFPVTPAVMKGSAVSRLSWLPSSSAPWKPTKAIYRNKGQSFNKAHLALQERFFLSVVRCRWVKRLKLASTKALYFSAALTGNIWDTELIYIRIQFTLNICMITIFHWMITTKSIILGSIFMCFDGTKTQDMNF